MAINPAKLLPPSKSSALTISQKSFILPKDNKVSDAQDVNNKLVKIDKFFKSDFLVSKKKSEVKRKEKEKKEFEEGENRLELPKLKGFSLPKMSLPTTGFLDKVKRFIFFTSLGWLLPKIIDFMPKLEGFVKIIGNVYQFAEGIFGGLFNGFMSLVKFGGDLKDKTLGFIAQSTGGDAKNFEQKFNQLEKQFNTFANLSILAGLVGLDMGLAGLDEYNKQINKRKPKPGEPSKPGRKAGIKVTTGKGGKPGLGKGAKVTQGKGGKVPGWWNRIFKGPFAKLKGPLRRFAGAAVPGLGAVVGAADARARFAAGDKIGGSLASVSAGLDGISAILALTGIGAAASAILTPISIGIDLVLLINDIGRVLKETVPFLSWLPTFNKGGRIVRRYQGGGTTRGGRPVKAPVRRTFTPTVRKRPPIVSIQKTQPGKDVGGEKKIKEFYAKPQDPNKRYTKPAGGWLASLSNFIWGGGSSQTNKNVDLSAFDTLKTMSGSLKDDQTLARGVLGIMSYGIDMALGQKPDKRGFKSLFDSIGYVADTLASQRMNQSMGSLSSQLRGFAEGGNVAPSRELRKTYGSVTTGDMLAKVLGPTIDQRVNEAIQSIENQLQQMKGGKSSEDGGGGGDGGSGGYAEGEENFVSSKEIYAYLKSKGLSHNHILGMLANIQAESSFNAGAIGDSGTSGGLFQHHAERFSGMVAFAGRDWAKNWKRQIDYALREDAGKQYSNKQFKTPEEASSWFTINFERPSNKESKAKQRLENLKNFGQDGSWKGSGSPQFKTGSFASGLYIGPPGDTDKQQTGLNMNLPGGIGAPIYAPFDLVYKLKGTDGNSSVGLQGTSKALGPKGKGFGYYGAYYFTKNGKEYEVLMGHFRDLPFKGAKDGDIIPKGTLIGYQGASGRSISSSGGVYPHISLHINGVGFKASNQELVEFANHLAGTKKDKKQKTKKLQAGGLVTPMKPNRTIPNSFASYENYGGTSVAIQPIIIRQQMPVIPSSKENGMIMFPVPVSVGVNNIDEIYSSSRGY